LGNGAINAANFLRESKELYKDIENKLRLILFPEDEVVNTPLEDKDTDENLDEILEGEK
jgi:hypothetical protein